MTKILSLIMALIAFLGGFFCAMPAETGNFKEIKDIPYGIDEEQKVDVFLPKNGSSVKGVTVFLHSGAWMSGYRSEFYDKMEYYADKLGIAAASVGYRYVGEGKNITYKDMLEDISAGIAAVKRVAAANGIKLEKAAVCGLSAGAHLSLLYAYGCADVSPLPISYVVAYAAPSDFTDEAYYATDSEGKVSAALPIELLCGADLSKGLTDPEARGKLSAASPISYVSSSSVPTVLVHGTADEAVPYSNALGLSAALEKAGAECRFFSYEGVGHLISERADADEKLRETLDEFANRLR